MKTYQNAITAKKLGMSRKTVRRESKKKKQIITRKKTTRRNKITITKKKIATGRKDKK